MSACAHLSLRDGIPQVFTQNSSFLAASRVILEIFLKSVENIIGVHLYPETKWETVTVFEKPNLSIPSQVSSSLDSPPYLTKWETVTVFEKPNLSIPSQVSSSLDSPPYLTKWETVTVFEKPNLSIPSVKCLHHSTAPPPPPPPPPLPVLPSPMIVRILLWIPDTSVWWKCCEWCRCTSCDPGRVLDCLVLGIIYN